VAGYAINVEQISGLRERQQNPFRRFVMAYREFLNAQKMWNARVLFDQKLGHIMKTSEMVAQQEKTLKQHNPSWAPSVKQVQILSAFSSVV